MTSIYLFLGLLTLAVLPASANSATKKMKVEKPTPVSVQKIANIDFYKEKKFVTNLRPFREVQVFSYIEGVIDKKILQNGQYVKKDQPIATIKNITPGYSYSKFIVKAPINGVVMNFYEESGTYVKKSASLLTVADTSRWRAAVPILQEDLPLLDAPHEVILTVDGKEKEISGKLYRIAPNVDQNLGTTVVEFTFPSRLIKNTRSGALSDLRIRYAKEKSIGINEKFLHESSRKKKKYVYIVKDDLTVQRRYLEIGIQRGEIVQITSGLKVGETIVTKMSKWWLKDGQKVEVQN